MLPHETTSQESAKTKNARGHLIHSRTCCPRPEYHINQAAFEYLPYACEHINLSLCRKIRLILDIGFRLHLDLESNLNRVLVLHHIAGVVITGPLEPFGSSSSTFIGAASAGGRGFVTT